MGGPHADGGDVEVDVLAWAEAPGVGHAEGDADGVAWESFDFSLCAFAANVVADNGDDTGEALKDPEDEGAEYEGLLWHAFRVHPDRG